MNGPQARPITILIAALGGEGGGVLTDWIVAAAAQLGLPRAIDVDSRRRSAHRRHHLLHRDRAGAGARAWRRGRCWRWRPASATSISCWRASSWKPAAPSPAGFVTPDRTLMIASTARSYLVVERMAMADGRYDSARLIKAIEDAFASRISSSTWKRWPSKAAP